MTRILVVDDMALVREPIAAALQAAGYQTLSAADGRTAMNLIHAQAPDLIILDLSMPVMDGMSVLESLRGAAATAKTPVILLTGSGDRNKVMQAAKLGVQGYLLKSQFSLTELLSRVKRYAVSIGDGHSQASEQPDIAEVAPGAIARTSDAPARSCAAPPPTPLTPDDCVRRMREALSTKTLSGVVAQVIATASSPRTDTSQLADLIARDPMLSARVLQVANTAAYTSSRGPVSTIPDAIKNIGLATVRNIAAALGIFEAMPETQPDGFNPIRCWQHSFAVAQLCERLQATVDPQQSGIAYLVGLCHDLGDILFHTHFGAEYRHVLHLEATTGRHRAELESQLLGMTHGQLVLTIMRQIGLPSTILAPVEAMHGAAGRTAPRDPMARLLEVADAFANGALLASSPAAPVAPLTLAACKAATGDPNPAPPDVAAVRNEVFTLTALLARLSSGDERQLMEPLFGRQDARVLLIRDRAFSRFDPVEAALASMANVELSDGAPASEQLAAADALVVVSRFANSGDLGALQVRDLIRRSGKAEPQCLWLNEAGDGTNDLRQTALPITLQDIANFVRSSTQLKNKATAA
jgi:HD-like signal output (HDOD) protein/DNA-binding NarL/FixJ family response regulator